MDIIAFSPVDFVPSIPDFIYVVDGDSDLYKISKLKPRIENGIKICKIDLENEIKEKTAQIAYLSNFVDDTWVAFEEQGLVSFKASEEKVWALKKSNQILEQMRAIKNDPQKVIELGKIAAKLNNIDIKNLFKRLEELRFSKEETLESVFKRVSRHV